LFDSLLNDSIANGTAQRGEALFAGQHHGDVFRSVVAVDFGVFATPRPRQVRSSQKNPASQTHMLPSPRRTTLGGKPAVMLGSSEMAAWFDVKTFRPENFPPSKSGLTAREFVHYKGTNPLTGAGDACSLPG
jgi:hypothetical protein